MMERDDRNQEEELVPETDEIPENQDIELENEEEQAGEKLKSLREKLKACEEEKRGHLEDLQRVRADFLNSKRRLEEQLTRDRERAKDDIIRELLTLADSFDMAIKDPKAGEIDETWRSGIEATHAKLLGILKAHGVTPIEALGKPFNPAEHEAVSNTGEGGGVETVTAVLQTGWQRGETVLRPAKVVVGAQ